MMIGAMMAKPIIKYVSIFAAFLIIVGAAYVKGRSDGSALCEAKYVAAELAWEKMISEAQLSAQDAINQIEIEFALKEQYYNTEIEKLRSRKPGVVTKVVKVYVPASVDTTMPKGFVELYNTTAKNQSLLNEVVDADKTTNIKLSNVATIAGDNNYTCNNIRDRLISLQKVVKEFQEAQDKLTK